MNELKPDECRVLGVLIEKALTTPGVYPLSLNAVVTGCNQKSNRNPVVQFDEGLAQAALDGLRAKGLVNEVYLSGSRVVKYRHLTQELLNIHGPAIAILAELLLRGPQTSGELRNRASRMKPIESLEIAQNVLNNMIEMDSPLVRMISPAPGSRAERYQQLLCEDLHPIDTAAYQTPQPSGTTTESIPDQSELVQRVEKLESELGVLVNIVRQIAQKLDINPHDL